MYVLIFIQLVFIFCITNGVKPFEPSIVSFKIASE